MLLLKSSSISLLIAVIVCCLTLHTATALLQRTRISRVMRLPVSQNESETLVTTTVTPIEAKQENDADKTEEAAIDSVDKDVADNDANDKHDNDDDDDDEDKEDADSKENDESALNTELQAETATTSLSVWGIVRGLWSLIRDRISESILERSNAGTSRTFAKIRRLQMAIIPLIFKFGILVAMVSLLVVLGFKTIFLLKVILFFNLIGLLAKFFTLKLKLGHHEPAPVWGHANWNYEPISHGSLTSDYGAEQHGPSKEIHLHIHGGQLQPQHGYSQLASYGSATQGTHGWDRRNDPYNSYTGYAASAPSATVMSSEQVSATGTAPYLPIKYDPNNRQY